MNMGLLPTGFTVDVRFDFRQRTHQFAVCVITIGFMSMQHEVGDATIELAVYIVTVIRMFMKPQLIGRADQGSYRGGLRGAVAVFAVRMSFHPADVVGLHGDGGEDQRIGGDKHNHRGQNPENSFPGSPALMTYLIKRCF